MACLPTNLDSMVKALMEAAQMMLTRYFRIPACRIHVTIHQDTMKRLVADPVWALYTAGKASSGCLDE